jgi:cytochrome c556
MMRILCAVAAVAFGATMVMAQNLPVIKQRQEIMKKTNDDTKVLNAMAKGEAPFDAAKAQALFGGIEERSKTVARLFPDDTKEGEKTRAKAEIWQNKADFDAKMNEFLKSVAAAKAASTSADSFKAAAKHMVDTCDNCHEKYRARRS